MKLSHRFLVALKFHSAPAYRVAQEAGIEPSRLSKLIHGAEKIRPMDSRIVAVGKILGLSPSACFAGSADGSNSPLESISVKDYTP